MSLQVTGQGGVPASGVSAVVVNVTAAEYRELEAAAHKAGLSLSALLVRPFCKRKEG